MAGEKLSHTEVQKRVDTCLDLRYHSDTPIKQREWLAYCDEHYGDKSKVQYLNYWQSAKEQYNDQWQKKLEDLLVPATDELFRLLADENPKIRQRAIDQIMRYSGNDVTKQEIQGKLTIDTVKFGTPE